MHLRIFISLLFFSVLLIGCKKEELKPVDNLVTGVKRVWALDDGEKIKREDISNPLATNINNLVWQDDKINIFGGRNEIISFQLIIQAEEDGADDVNVVISDLDNGTAIIPGSEAWCFDPFDFTCRYIELFTEHYLHITNRTPPLWFFSPSAMPSSYYTGWIPDCLIPFSAPSGKGGAPFSINGNNNQGVWVDIYIPRDALAGTYEGEATVTVSDSVFMIIPVLLKVYDFTLPDTTHIKNMFGFYPYLISQRYGVSRRSRTYYDLEAKFFQVAHRHRIDLVNMVDNLADMTNYYKRYYTGEIYTAAYGYAGPGENIGNITFSIGYGGEIPDEYGESVYTMTESSWWAGSDAWENWFTQNAPGVERHKYLFPDEPDWKGPAGALGTGSMDTIKMQANWTHNNPGIGRNIPCLVTNTIKPVIKGYVDFWSVSSQEATVSATANEVASEKVQGHKYGIYNGYRPGMGAVVIDADAVEFRVMPWIVWKYDIDQYFYWSTNFWTTINVFDNPLTYNDDVNGDGTFFYPGVDLIFPKEDRGLSGPLSSIRAKNWRRGAQDYEYLWLAKQAGSENEIKTIVDNCVPAALWEAKSRGNISWSSRGYVFEQYRKQLAELISGR
jgi:hypothetical protein